MSERKYNRVFLVVMDSLGIGNAPDALEYKDEDRTRSVPLHVLLEVYVSQI
ncbi:phosphopentomutase [Geomicrobium sp. JCM 19037]|nr:phosphopentomutase [Geomicrobium sp. JCM 19037]